VRRWALHQNQRERSDHDALFIDLLEIADQEPLALLLRALSQSTSPRVFAKN
jgi:hypothetical protein